MRLTLNFNTMHTVNRRLRCVCLFIFGWVAFVMASSALADPVVVWITPPVWLQTPTESAPGRPGMTITGKAWLSTGKGGQVGIRVGNEVVELDQNSLWEWQGLDDGSVGSSLQGNMRVGSAPGKGGDPGNKQTANLRLGAPWMLVMDAGNNAASAEALVVFLRNSGYPVSETQRLQHPADAHWHFWLDGFSNNEAAAYTGAKLLALAPGILSATPKRKPMAVMQAVTEIAAVAAAPIAAPVLAPPVPAPITKAIAKKVKAPKVPKQVCRPHKNCKKGDPRPTKPPRKSKA